MESTSGKGDRIHKYIQGTSVKGSLNLGVQWIANYPHHLIIFSSLNTKNRTCDFHNLENYELFNPKFRQKNYLEKNLFQLEIQPVTLKGNLFIHQLKM